MERPTSCTAQSTKASLLGVTSCGPVKHSTYQGMLAPVGPEVIGNKMSAPVPVKKRRGTL